MQTLSMKLAMVLLVVILVASGTMAWAQGASNTGTVQGAITDQQGAVVVGATVSLTDVGTKTARTTTTNASGRYIFVDVPPGTYNEAISKPGFATMKTDSLEVTVGGALTLDLALQVGGASVVIEVQTTGSELQTMNATVGNTLNSIAIDNLPSIGRDVNTFIELQPGVGTDGAVAGAVNDQSFFSLDGGNNSNDMDGNGTVYTGTQVQQSVGDPTGGVGNQVTNVSGPSGVMPTPADSVEEFKVNSAGQTADFNSSAGAEIKIVTKRGTDAWHGTAYEYYKDNNWSSNSWQNNELNYLGDHIGLPAYHYSRFGGSIGGPLIPKEIFGGKTYFFFNYEGFKFPQSQTINRNVPSPALQQGLLLDDTTGAVDFNLNNSPVTYNNKTILANGGAIGCAAAPGGLCDPLGLGLNPLVSQIWSKYEPASNAPCLGSLCDGANILGFSGNLSIPIDSKFAVGRIDHDFSSKQHFMTSYRYYNMKFTSNEQIDIGGFFPGDTKGVPGSVSSDPVQAWYLVAGLTTNLTPNTTNDLHYSFLRNWWQWGRAGSPPQIPGLGGALEIMSGQNASEDLGPFNVNNQQTRRRWWDGHDQFLRDDLSQLHGNHLFQYGGYFAHNWDYHQRNDSGGLINAYPVYELGNGQVKSDAGSIYPCSLLNSAGNPDVNNCSALSAAVLGIVSISSQVFTRSGPTLALNPPLTPASDKSTIPYYNVYFSDTWHLKPTFTLTYGLGWALEMPPTEANGKQAVLVDQSNEPLNTSDYLANRKRAALAGQVYNPELGFALVGNAANGLKYPYNPFYGEFSPRVAVAWSPRATDGILANTVVRAGYGRQYGRTNGVDQVLVPLLGLGLEQPLQCTENQNIPAASGSYFGNGSCGASGSTNPVNAFRVGLTPSAVGGPIAPIANPTPTLPQPDYPGYNNSQAAAPEALDPHFRPNVIDSFNVTIQHQLNRKVTLELGYIGRRITHEFQPYDLNTVPYMMTQGGQTFANAYMNTVLQYCGGIAGLAGGKCAANAGAVTNQPFFETALAGTGYCQIGGKPSSCTQAVIANEGAGTGGTGNLTNASVWNLWTDLDSGSVGCPATGCSNPAIPGAPDAFNFPRSMQSTPIPGSPNGAGGQVASGMALNASLGYGNYNGAFVSVKMADWRGLTMQSNFTWSKALGTGALVQATSAYTPLDGFNLASTYGSQAFDRRITYNAFMVYQPPFYKGQKGMMGRVLGGWTFSTIFTTGTGTPTDIETSSFNNQSFGGADGLDYANNENAVPIGPVGAHSHAYSCHGAAPSNGAYYSVCAGQSPQNGYPVNEFKDGANEYMNWRNPILGMDTRDGGVGILTGLPYWNMDFSIKKNFRIAESVSLEFQGVFANVFNHDQLLDSTFQTGLYNPTGFGALGGGDGSLAVGEAGPRNIELGARVRF